MRQGGLDESIATFSPFTCVLVIFRAFLNGKLDLTEVEGLADLIHAETEAQRKQALRQMEVCYLNWWITQSQFVSHYPDVQLHWTLLSSLGDLGRLYEQWSRDLLQCVAHVEAFIDFGEDENIEEDVLDTGGSCEYHMVRHDWLKLIVTIFIVKSDVEILHGEILQHLDDGRRGERLRSGVHVAIVGAPNSGKSSLLNILCKETCFIAYPLAKEF